MKVVLALVAALALGLPAALVARNVAGAVQSDPDPIAVGAVFYPGVPLVAGDPFAGDDPGWLRFMNARAAGPPHVAPRDSVSVDPADARARAEADGWRVEEGVPDSYAFAAVKGGAAVDFYADSFLVVHKRAAWWVTALTILGGLLGAALGGWLARSAARRAGRKTPRSRTVIRETVVVGAALLVPVLAQSLLRLFGVADLPLPYSASLLLELARWPAVLGLLLLGAAVAALRWAPEARPAAG